jgi:hypothetical protein
MKSFYVSECVGLYAIYISLCLEFGAGMQYRARETEKSPKLNLDLVFSLLLRKHTGDYIKKNHFAI